MNFSSHCYYAFCFRQFFSHQKFFLFCIVKNGDDCGYKQIFSYIQFCYNGITSLALGKRQRRNTKIYSQQGSIVVKRKIAAIKRTPKQKKLPF